MDIDADIQKAVKAVVVGWGDYGTVLHSRLAPMWNALFVAAANHPIVQVMVLSAAENCNLWVCERHGVIPESQTEPDEHENRRRCCMCAVALFHPTARELAQAIGTRAVKLDIPCNEESGGA